MLFDAIKRCEVVGIPTRAKVEWDHFAGNINTAERAEIIAWINSKFDDVSIRSEKVQPAGWLGSGFNWNETSLSPIYRECYSKLSKMSDLEIEGKSGQIFGLFVSLTLAEHRDHETWYFVKGDEYKAHGIPIKSRIYFLPNDGE